MKNLQNFGVQELNIEEKKVVSGGDFGMTLLGALLAYAIIDAVENPSDFWDGVAYHTSHK